MKWSDIDEMFKLYVGSFPIECIQLEAAPSLNDALFSRRRSFSDYASHALFTINGVKTGYSLLDLLNYIPDCELDAATKEDEVRREHREEQRSLVTNFVYAYKSFHCSTFDTPTHSSKREEGDIERLIKLSLAFGPSAVHTLEEVGIQTNHGDDNLPHGNIDLLVYSIDEPEFYVALKESGTIPPDTEGVDKLLCTSAKTDHSFKNAGSDRQCVVEILALSEVLKSMASDNKLVIFFQSIQK